MLYRTIVVFIGCCPFVLNAQKQQQPVDSLNAAKELEPVVVTASRVTQKRSEVPVAIAVITRQTISDTRATRIDQLINKVSGVNMVDLGNEQHEMSIRQPMTTKSLFLYLEDGIPVRTAGLYNHNALLEMNMAAARQIEVIKGPASALYGAEAIGGAVNILTQEPPDNTIASLSLQVSNTGYKRAEAQAGSHLGKLGLLVSGYYAGRQNGPLDHSDFHKTAFSVRADYQVNSTTKWVNSLTYVDYYSDMLGALDSVHFANKDYSTPQTFTYRKVPALRYRSQLFRQWNANSFFQAGFVFRHNTVAQNPSYRIKNASATLANGEINESTFSTYLLFVQQVQQFKWMKSRLITGLSFDLSPSKYLSNYISIRRDGRGYYMSYDKTDSVLSKYGTGISNFAGYASYELSPFKGLKLVAALRYDRYRYRFTNDLPPSAFSGAPSSLNHFGYLSPKLGATYNHGSVGFYVNYSEGFVPPQISELYTGVKVPYLGPQTFFNYEVGGWISLVKHHLYADWSYYLLKGSNEIVNVKNPDGSTENRNTGKTQHAGIEYGITYKPSGQWMIRLSAANSKHRFIDYVEKNVAYNGMEMPGAPHFFSNAELMYKPVFIKGLRIGLEWQHLGSYYMDNLNTKKYGGYDLLNIRTGYKLKAFEIWVNVLNAGNRYYSTLASKSGSTLAYNLGDPREISVGIAYQFVKK